MQTALERLEILEAYGPVIQRDQLAALAEKFGNDPIRDLPGYLQILGYELLNEGSFCKKEAGQTSYRSNRATLPKTFDVHHPKYRKLQPVGKKIA